MDKTMSEFLKNSRQWKEEIKLLRSILNELKLEEDFKWGKPCYSFDEKNIAIIQPFKKYLGLMFFKGKLLKDPKKILKLNGPNSQSAMRMEFVSVEEIKKSSALIKSYIKEAIKIEVSGQKIILKKKPESIPSELKVFFKNDLAFKDAFEALTPGRQRGYILHFSSAKQTITRQSRIEKCRPNILKGKGLSDR